MLNYTELYIISDYLSDIDKLKLISCFDENEIISELILKYDGDFYKTVIDSGIHNILQQYINNKNLGIIQHQKAYTHSLKTNKIKSADIISTKLGRIPDKILEIAGNNNSIELLRLVQKHMGINKSCDYYKALEFIENNNFRHIRYLCIAQKMTFNDDGLLAIKLAIKNKNRDIAKLIYDNSEFDINKMRSIVNYEINTHIATALEL